jgi:hypothetical protein
MQDIRTPVPAAPAEVVLASPPRWHWLAVAACAMAPQFVLAAATPDPITPADKNAESLHEVLVMTASMLYSEIGPASTMLSYSGGFGSDGWTATLGGTYLGLAVNLSFIGMGTATAGSYTASGFLGGNAYSSSGSWTYTDNAIGDATLDFDLQASYLGFIWDRHSLAGIRNIKQVLPDGYTSKTDFGRYRRTLFGIPVGAPYYEQISDWIYPPNRPQDAIVSFTLGDEGIALTGSGDWGTGAVQGVIAVPEPAAAWLLMLGLGAGLGVLPALHRRGTASRSTR